MRDASPLQLEKFWSRGAQDQSEINPDHHWELLLDTANDRAPSIRLDGGEKYHMIDRSLALFRTRPQWESTPDVTPLQAEEMRKEMRRIGWRTFPGGSV